MKRSGFGHFSVTQPFFDAAAGAGAGAGDATAVAAAAAAAAVADKVTMTNAELDALIKGRVDSAVALATKKKDPGTSEADKAELETLRKEREDRARAELEKKGQYDAALKSQEDSIRKEYEPKLTAETEKAKTAQAKLEEKVVGLAVSDAAGKLNAVNPEQVRRLLGSNVKMNDAYEAIVVDDAGAQRFVAGKPMTSDQLVKEFLDANPHLVRSTAGAGGGAGGGRSLTTGDATAIQTLEAKVKALADEATKTGSPRTLVAHEQAVKELAKLKAGVAA